MVARGAAFVKIGITCYPTYGGSGAIATELGMALAARGHEVHFITYQQPFRLPVFLPRVYFHEVDIGNYPLFQYPPYDLALAVRMHEVVINEKLDLLHVHYAIPHATSAWIAKEMLKKEGRDIRVITTLHGTDITIVGQDHSYHAITKFSIEQSDSVTAVSNWLRAETVRTFGCAGSTVEVIPNFVDPAVYNRAAHAPVLRDQFGADKKILMHMSNFRPVKRVVDLIRIFAEVRKNVPSVLVMVGDGPDRALAEEETRTLGLQGDVYFFGRIEAVAPLLASADLLLVTTDRESFGVSALEALATGVPVVGYGVGGLVEVVKDGITGSLHDVGDIAAMARACVTLLSDEVRWQAMSTAAAADARERFSLNDVVAQYEALYTGVPV